MPLTHVCIWDSQIGYRRITIDEACSLYPYSVSVDRGFFICELCAQNLGLSKARKDTGTRYFFHSSGEQDKTCEARQSSYNAPITSLNEHTMPLRIAVQGTAFSLQLGFFWPRYSKAYCEKVRITGNSRQAYEYSFERIEHAGTTYLDVGTIPSENYELDYINANAELKRYWANKTPGVKADGSFFDSQSGRMLQLGGKAYSGNTYYLLQRGRLYSFAYRDIEATEITHITGSFSTWYLYRVRVKQFSENAAKFFLQRSIFLTERATRFYPLWPPYIEDPYFIYHNNSEFYFYLCGDDAELKAYPTAAHALNVHSGRLYKLYLREREQLISLGKSGALGFSYLVKGPLNKRAPLPAVTIFNHSGTELDEETCSNLPKSKFIRVSCKYDGKAVVKRNGRVSDVYKLSAEQDTIIDGLLFDTEIYFYQGCDCVRIIRFEQKKSSVGALIDDQTLAKKLGACNGPTIPVSHAIGALAGKYAAYPQTRKWLLRALRRGELPRRALQLLKDNIPDNIGRVGND